MNTKITKLQSKVFERSFNLLTLLVLFFICNPYIAISKILDSDLQPEAIIFCSTWLLIFFGKNLYQDKPIPISIYNIFFLIIFIYSISISLLLDSFNFRGVGPYASIFIFSYFGLLLGKDLPLLLKVIKISSIVSFLIGIFQYLFNKKYFLFLLATIRTSPNRGVTALNPEPSYYSITCLLYILTIDLLAETKKEKTIYFSLLFFQILFLAQSFTAFIGLILWISLRIVTSYFHKINFKNMFYTLLISPFLFYMLLISLPQSRFKSLLNSFVKNPMDILFKDQSSNDRLSDILYSTGSFILQYPYTIGNGFNGWTAFVHENKNIFPIINSAVGTRIMSGYGAAIFELGGMGILLILAIFIIFWHKKSPFQSVSIFFSIYLFVAVPLATPLIGTLIGIGLSKRYFSNT